MAKVIQRSARKREKGRGISTQICLAARGKGASHVITIPKTKATSRRGLGGGGVAEMSGNIAEKEWTRCGGKSVFDALQCRLLSSGGKKKKRRRRKREEGKRKKKNKAELMSRGGNSAKPGVRKEKRNLRHGKGQGSEQWAERKKRLRGWGGTDRGGDRYGHQSEGKGDGRDVVRYAEEKRGD